MKKYSAIDDKYTQIYTCNISFNIKYETRQFEIFQ